MEVIKWVCSIWLILGLVCLLMFWIGTRVTEKRGKRQAIALLEKVRMRGRYPRLVFRIKLEGKPVDYAVDADEFDAFRQGDEVLVDYDEDDFGSCLILAVRKR
jgi:hypothetical protein